MTQSNLPPIRSKSERERSTSNGSVPPAAADGTPDDSGVGADSDLDALRRSAQALGYEIRREPRRRRPRPDSRDGRVSTTCRLDPAVRDALDQARLQLNMNYSDMINAGVVLFMESQNLRVGVSHEDFLPN
jgi:hypothetical protein